MEDYVFGDLFTYDCSTDLIGGRRFFCCKLLKDMYGKSKGESVSMISLEVPGRISFDEGKTYFFFCKKEPSLKNIQREVFERLMKNIHIDCFGMWSSMEDHYGMCFSLRTCTFIEAYMTSLKYEFEKSTQKIKHHWKRVISNPNYLMCRKRLMREFIELT